MNLGSDPAEKVHLRPSVNTMLYHWHTREQIRVGTALRSHCLFRYDLHMLEPNYDIECPPFRLERDQLQYNNRHIVGHFKFLGVQKNLSYSFIVF